MSTTSIRAVHGSATEFAVAVIGARSAVDPEVSMTTGGASFRGEGNGSASVYDAASFTAQRCAAAVRAGVAAVLDNLTGIVVWID
jgi:hypothetical protein